MIEGTVKAEQNDTGWEEIKRRFAEIKEDFHVKVGIVGPQATQPHPSGEGQTYVDVAVSHHEGLGNNPERPFLSQPVEQRMKQYKAILAEYGQEVLNGDMSQKQALGLIGEIAVGDVKEDIVDKKYAPNAPSTVQGKTTQSGEGDTPLIDTKAMVNAITYEVSKRK